MLETIMTGQGDCVLPGVDIYSEEKCLERCLEEKRVIFFRRKRKNDDDDYEKQQQQRKS